MGLHKYCSAAEENKVSNPDICAINAIRALEYIVRALYQMKNIEIGERTSLYELVDGRGPRSGRDLVFRCYPPELLPPKKKQKLTFWVSLVSGDPVRITPVIFRTGLRRWRSVFLFPTTGYLTREGKSLFSDLVENPVFRHYFHQRKKA